MHIIYALRHAHHLIDVQVRHRIAILLKMDVIIYALRHAYHMIDAQVRRQLAIMTQAVAATRPGAAHKQGGGDKESDTAEAGAPDARRFGVQCPGICTLMDLCS